MIGWIWQTSKQNNLFKKWIHLWFVCASVWRRFQVKFFYLTQLAYWLHALPELYFQKVRKVSTMALEKWRNVTVCGSWEVMKSMFYFLLGGDASAAAVHLPVFAAHLCSLSVKVRQWQAICYTHSGVLVWSNLRITGMHLSTSPWPCCCCFFLYSMTRVGLVLLFLQYVSELGFHIARLFYFTDENHQKM